ncbi:hypothetical protein SDC9_90656 [bioreactor metagenome]|uniref:Uncharacterized protein n=1 Tax=bioreactor metagenome TaxID=1076179 RepID=A0A644ZU94_9ZZZZ
MQVRPSVMTACVSIVTVEVSPSFVTVMVSLPTGTFTVVPSSEITALCVLSSQLTSAPSASLTNRTGIMVRLLPSMYGWVSGKLTSRSLTRTEGTAALFTVVAVFVVAVLTAVFFAAAWLAAVAEAPVMQTAPITNATASRIEILFFMVCLLIIVRFFLSKMRCSEQRDMREQGRCKEGYAV